VVVGSRDPGELAGVGVHEAFHVFERATARPDRRFGGGENSALVSRYPVFQLAAETAFALELRLLDDALRSTDQAECRELARQFLAVREERHRRIDDDMARFDRMAELNEGLAEYALVRTLAQLAAAGDPRTRERATLRLAERTERLRTVGGNESQSVRLRFYATGPAMALLLDRIEGPSWKARLVREDLTLQEALAGAVGYRDAERVLRTGAERRYTTEGLAGEAAARIERLRARRRAQLDSVLALPGIQLVVDASGMAQRDVGLCGFDPQNTLRLSENVELHMRYLRPCNTSETFGEFNTAVVHDEAAGTITAVLGPEDQVRVTVGGEPVLLADGERRESLRAIRIAAPNASYQAGRGTLQRRGRVLRLTLLPN
jgi:hypothetical protein